VVLRRPKHPQGFDWRAGAFYFEEVLLDYDCAMNYGNWVTVARVAQMGAYYEIVPAYF